MNRCYRKSDFFQYGKQSVLAEVRQCQAQGEWTEDLRKRRLKQATLDLEQIRCRSPWDRHHRTYFAGRLSALKSRQTAHFEPQAQSPKPLKDLIIFRPLAPGACRFCGFFDCGDEALWGVCLWEDEQPFVLLCDTCRQEWMRCDAAYTTPDGWDWDCDEEVCFAEVIPSKTYQLIQKREGILLGQVVLPLAFLIGFNVSNILWQTSPLIMITQLFIVGCVQLQSIILVRLLFWLFPSE